jgi:hypothetical protein
MIAADLLPAPGRPEGPVERAWWPAVEAAAYIISRALRSNGKSGGPGMHRKTARAEIKLSEATREGLPARGRKKPGDPAEPIPASDLRPAMVETKNLPVNLLYPPKVVVRVDGTPGISPPHRGNYIGPPWCSIEVDSAALRQACPKPLIRVSRLCQGAQGRSGLSIPSLRCSRRCTRRTAMSPTCHRRATELRRTRHAPARQHKFSHAVRPIAHNRRRIVGEDARHRRQRIARANAMIAACPLAIE